LPTIPEGKTYFKNARNLRVNGPCKKALTLNIPANKQLLFTFWAIAHLLSGRTECGTEYEYIQGYIPSKDDDLKFEIFDVTLSGFCKLMEFPTKLVGAATYDPLLTEAEMIEFLDSINYQWDPEKTKSVSAVKLGKMISEFIYLFANFIQCLSGKVGSVDQASTAHLQMVLSVVKNRKIDRAKLIYQDPLNKLRLPKDFSKKKTKRETGVV